MRRIAWLVASMGSIGCGGELLEGDFSQATETGSQTCEPGDVRSCPCNAVERGSQRCEGSAGAWGACECPGDPSTSSSTSMPNDDTTTSGSGSDEDSTSEGSATTGEGSSSEDGTTTGEDSTSSSSTTMGEDSTSSSSTTAEESSSTTAEGGCGDGVVDPGEDCDDGGESATCDADCTAVSCGDGTVNATAGETCDDGGESATCDADCTAVSCGDGTVNATAGETCDDGGESATCDADCTAVSCGDGTVNATAGEVCDDAGESATCDTDCTAAVCGDGVANATAGEECDDGDLDNDDGCLTTCEACTNLGSVAFTDAPAGLVADWSTSLAASYDDLTVELWANGTAGGLHLCNVLLASYDTPGFGPVWLCQSEDAALADGSWHHVARVWDAEAAEQRLYVDGDLVDTQPYVEPTIGAAGLWIGGGHTTDGNYFAGAMQGIRVSASIRYTSAFTPSIHYGPEPDTLLFLPLTTSVGGEAIDFGPLSIPVTDTDQASAGPDGPFCWDPP